jgi:Arc/MetJ family transcription regulator
MGKKTISRPVKTTVEIDDARLTHVMRLARLKTRKAALEYALIETEKMLQMRNLAAKSFYEGSGPVIDKNYDLKKIRQREK